MDCGENKKKNVHLNKLALPKSKSITAVLWSASRALSEIQGGLTPAARWHNGSHRRWHHRAKRQRSAEIWFQSDWLFFLRTVKNWERFDFYLDLNFHFKFKRDSHTFGEQNVKNDLSLHSD